MKKYMDDNKGYSDEPMKIGRVVDILPSPSVLAEVARGKRTLPALSETAVAAPENRIHKDKFLNDLIKLPLGGAQDVKPS